MKQEEAAGVILNIFQRKIAKNGDKAGDVLSHKVLHVEYFKKTGSGLGFFEGVNWLLKKKWLEAVEGQENCHRMTRAGRQADL